MLDRTIQLHIKNNLYDVSFPNNGQLIDITVIRGKMTEGQYSHIEITAMYDPMVKIAKNTIDMISTFNVLIPKLKEHLAVKTLLELSVDQTSELLEVYMSTYLPWYEAWVALLTAPKKEEENPKDIPAN